MMKILILVVIAKQITVLDRAARNSNSGKIIHKELYAAIDTLLVKGEPQAASAASPFHRTP